jgi:hypothetical protein
MLKLEIGKVYNLRSGNMIITRMDSNFVYAKNIKYNCEIENEEFIFSDLNEKRLEKAIKFNELKETTIEVIMNDYLQLA